MRETHRTASRFPPVIPSPTLAFFSLSFFFSVPRNAPEEKGGGDRKLPIRVLAPSPYTTLSYNFAAPVKINRKKGKKRAIPLE